MSALAALAAEYLETRRALGYQLDTHAKILRAFVRYLDDTGATRVTVEAALGFATQPANAQPIWWQHRLSVARGFARYARAFDPATEVPPRNLLADANPRRVPYVYSPEEVSALMLAARRLQPALRGVTCETVIGLLAVTGLRIGEVLALDRSDVDLKRELLVIRHPKFNRDRIVPVHPSTVSALEHYARRRDEWRPTCPTPSFFVSSVGTRLGYGAVQKAFAAVVAEIGLDGTSDRCRPRLHDFRHRFAIQTLLNWYRSDADVASKMPVLSTYLGHVKPKDTYWYLSATPELLALAASRLERSAGLR